MSPEENDQTIPSEDIDVLIVKEKELTDDEIEAKFNADVEEASKANQEFIDKTVKGFNENLDKFSEDLSEGKIDSHYQKRHEDA